MLSRFFPFSPCLSRCDPPGTLGDGRPQRHPRPGWQMSLHLVGDHAFEGTETIQTRIVGADITGTGACS